MTNINNEQFYIEIAQNRIYVERWTPLELQSEIPIILLHDSLGCSALWRDFPQQLSECLMQPVISYDRLGYGRSTTLTSLPKNDFIEHEALHIFPEIIKALQLQQYMLFGYSVGGGIAFNIAAQDENCIAIISMSAQAFVEEKTIRGIKSAEQFFNKSPEQLSRLTKWHDKKAQWVLDAWTKTWLSPAFSQWSLLTALVKVNCPVLVIHGDEDEYGSLAFPNFIKTHLKGFCNILIIEGCGHTPHKTHSSEVFINTKNFIKGHFS